LYIEGTKDSLLKCPAQPRDVMIQDMTCMEATPRREESSHISSFT
jgi:hypothetical protein